MPIYHENKFGCTNVFQLIHQTIAFAVSATLFFNLNFILTKVAPEGMNYS